MSYLSELISLYPILSLINSVILFGLYYLGEKIIYYLSIDKLYIQFLILNIKTF